MPERGKDRKRMRGQRTSTGRGKRVKEDDEERSSEEGEEEEEEPQQPTTVIMEGVREAGSGAGGRRGKREMRGRGLSLGMKFALVISIVAAGLCFFSELFVYAQTKTALLAEIDRKGAALVRSVSVLAEQYAKEYIRVYEEHSKEKAKKTDASKEVLKNLTAQKNEIRDRYAGYLSKLLTSFKDNKQLKSEEIQAALFQSLGNEEMHVICGEKVKLSGNSQAYYESIGGAIQKTPITIITGQMTDDQGTFGTRTYKYPTIKEQLNAIVVLSEKEIEEAMSKLFIGILISTILAILVAVGISFFLASRVTNPLRRLVRDIETVSGGNLDHTTAVVSHDEIGVLANAFNVMTKNLKIAHESELEHKAREHELNIATEIQANLLPKQIPKISGFDIAAFYRPSKEVGGDYYDFIAIDENHIGFVVADVSGKGIPGSMVMTMARALIRMEALGKADFSPARTFTAVNSIIAQDIKLGMFVTAMYVVLDTTSGEIYIASAGHNPAVLWRSKTRANDFISPKGIALGFDKGTMFQRAIQEERHHLNPGDRLVLYTDGVPEAMSPDNQEFGEDRFAELITHNGDKNSNQFVNILVSSLEEWKGSATQSDDITIVTVRRT